METLGKARGVQLVTGLTGCSEDCLLAEWIHFTLYTFWDNITPYKTESVHFWGL